MQKRRFLIGAVFLLTSCLLSGCGVAQGKYDAVVAERNTAQKELQSVRADNKKLISENKDLQVEKPSLTTESESLKADYDELSTEYKALQAERNALVTEKEALEADYNQLNTQNADVLRELNEIKESYNSVRQELGGSQTVSTRKYFSAVQELKSWIQKNAISDKPLKSNMLYTYKAYMRAVEIQEAALRDGYLISAIVLPDMSDPYGKLTITRMAYCIAKLDNGIYYWHPDRDEIGLLAKIKTEEQVDPWRTQPMEPKFDWE